MTDTITNENGGGGPTPSPFFESIMNSPTVPAPNGDDHSLPGEVNVNLMTDEDYSPEVRAEVIAALQPDPFYGPLLETYGADSIVGDGCRRNCDVDIDRFMPVTAAKLTALSLHRRALSFHQRLGPFWSRMIETSLRLDTDIEAFVARFADHVAGDQPVLRKLLVDLVPNNWPWDLVEWAVLRHERNCETPVIDAAPVIEAPPSLEDALNRIQKQKKALYEQRKRSNPEVVNRYRRRNSVSDRAMHEAILAGMRREPDRKHAKHELEAYAEMAGLSYRAVPFHLTCMVAQGLIERVHFGWYRLPSSAA